MNDSCTFGPLVRSSFIMIKGWKHETKTRDGWTTASVQQIWRYKCTRRCWPKVMHWAIKFQHKSRCIWLKYLARMITGFSCYCGTRRVHELALVFLVRDTSKCSWGFKSPTMPDPFTTGIKNQIYMHLRQPHGGPQFRAACLSWDDS